MCVYAATNKVQDKETTVLLKQLVLPNAMKGMLPAHLQFLYRGGLIFPKPELLPFSPNLVAKIPERLTRSQFDKHGGNLSQVIVYMW